jgi:hypothetical protein
MASANEKRSRDVCLSVTGPVPERYSLDGACLPLHHAARMFRNLRQPALLLQFRRPSLRRAVTAYVTVETAEV